MDRATETDIPRWAVGVTSVAAVLFAARLPAAVSETAAPVQQDVIIMYTDATRAKWRQAGIEARAAQAVSLANNAYVNSGVNIDLVLLRTAPSPVQEATAGMEATLDAFQSNDSVNSVRDTYGADFMVLLSENADNCGRSHLWSNGDVAHAVINSTCAIDSMTFVHEVGHLQGLNHERDAAETSPGYNYGYRVCATDGFRDLMSTDCSNGTNPPRILYFSTPSHTYNGYPLGIAYEVDPTHAADAVRALNESAISAAAYRRDRRWDTPPAPLQ